jgi:ATP-binding cassette, subfamily B (MDR/TAP), member 1
VAFWYMGLEISRGHSSFEEAFKAFFAIFLAAFGAAQAQAYFPDVARGKAAVQRVFAIIDRRSAIDAADPSGLRPATCEGSVELQNVTFCYPARPEAPVFVDFSLTVPAGKTVALVGESGSGKSTVIQLIERFYDPQAGSVLLDGVDLRQLNLKWLRSYVGLVSQEPVLFNMTVADNIRYGNPGATLEAAVAAAKAANADGFISALPEGYHTRLGEGAIQLSGGQKQRVAIARALLKDPRVLLLDEATSALDAESERVVQAALDRLMHGRTTLVVAHRLSTVRDADSIAVVYKGHIVEQGRHAELVAAGGAYARLVAHQMSRN